MKIGYSQSSAGTWTKQSYIRIFGYVDTGFLHLLHTDCKKLMPKSRLAWSCWNYLSSSAVDSRGIYKANIDQVALWVDRYCYGHHFPSNGHFDRTCENKKHIDSRNRVWIQPSLDFMNDLQHIPEVTTGPVLVTLNPPFEPQEDLIQGRWAYEHPVLDSEVSCVTIFRCRWKSNDIP